jgi:prepilin-type N-terminal cleavage/methylation domain-containing protein
VEKVAMLKHKLNQDGFTLVEVLVSIVILSIVLTTFFSFFGQSLVFSGKNEEKLVAYNLAEKTMRIVESNYKNKLQPTQTKIVIPSTNNPCSNYSSGYPPELLEVTNPSTCYYKENQKNYYPYIIIMRQPTDFTAPSLFVINVKIYNSNILTDPNRKLLSETFGYIRGK